MSDDLAHLSAWVGRRERAEDVIAPGPAARLAATLDRDDRPPRPGDALPPAWHWLYFLSATRHSMLGADGHDSRGGFMPPVELPRRMWAGGRMTFHRHLRIGEEAVRESEVVSVTPKRGKSGDLVFVTVRHVVSGSDGPAVTDEHDIVYLDRSRPGDPGGAPHQPPRTAVWRRAIHPDPVLLMRFSALTFNAHRIHHDLAYATGVEGHPGLVVHGPLIAVLLLDLVRRERPGDTPTGFDYQARAPLFDTAPFTLAGAPAEDGRSAALWAEGPDGGAAMTATATFAPRQGG